MNSYFSYAAIGMVSCEAVSVKGQNGAFCVGQEIIKKSKDHQNCCFFYVM